MSALGHKRTFAVQKGMSALPPKADINRHICACISPTDFIDSTRPSQNQLHLFARSLAPLPRQRTAAAGTQTSLIA